MSSPKILVQILVTGTRILGKAFLEAGRQAVKNAKHSPQALSSDVAGVGRATSGSVTDQLTRQHRMTLDEAHLILNVKREDSLEQVLKHYEHLFKANSPPPKPEKQPVTSKKSSPPAYSHYIQSKVFRARERIEAEHNTLQAAESEASGSASTTSPPPSSSSSSSTSHGRS